MTGIILRTTHRITKREVRLNADTTYYVFGDNMVRRGLGGLAKTVRLEKNSVGIPTKYLPSTEPQAYFSDDVMGITEVMSEIDGALRKIDRLLANGWDVVIPTAGIGSGLAELPTRAPRLYNYIEQKLKFIEQKYSTRRQDDER